MNYSEYFSNEKFSNSLSFKIDKPVVKLNRIEFIKKQVKNKNILHFGFVDHNINLAKNKKWLHSEMLSSAKAVYGVDILKKEVFFYKKKGMSNLFCFNILTDPIPKKVQDVNFDFVILGEILEHVSDPLSFLKIINSKIKFKKILITVPNAFSINNFFNAFKTVEKINSDHYFWFTPYTISKHLHLSNYVVEKIYFSDYKHRFNFIFSLLKNFAFFNQTIIIVAKKL